MSAPSGERRIYDRHRFAAGGLDPPLATVGLVPRAALISDLSPSGVGLITTQPPPIGALVPVYMSGPPGMPSSVILGTIAYTTPEPDGLFRIGVICLEECLGVLRALIDQLVLVGWITA